MTDQPTHKNGETFYVENEIEIGADGFVKSNKWREVPMSETYPSNEALKSDIQHGGVR